MIHFKIKVNIWRGHSSDLIIPIQKSLKSIKKCIYPSILFFLLLCGSSWGQIEESPEYKLGLIKEMPEPIKTQVQSILNKLNQHVPELVQH